jgi:hypothetical protein
MKLVRKMGMVAAGVCAVVLAVAALAEDASAQTPTGPRAATSCTGTLVLTPNPAFAGRLREVQVSASGLEPNAPFAIFAAGAAPVTGTTNSGGTTTDTLFFQLLPTGLLSVQVVTPGSCAAGTLTVFGPRFIVCNPVFFMNTLVCPFVIVPGATPIFVP